MFRFSIDGVASFSYKPLKWAASFGLAVVAASFIYLIFSLAQILFSYSAVSWWQPLMACLFLLDGVVLIVLGVLGEYVGRIYDETKNRLLYVLRNKQELEAAKRNGVILSE
ncbi:MAG: Glycosyl transferase, family 2 [Desulfotomaculum sp. 46_80]|nr:MAG: Glycosyl transferase, family 2 [Desulfotomaculum sp. 46_80]